MIRTEKQVQVDIQASALVLCAVLLLMLPLQWVVGILAAAAVHECFHALAVWLLGGKILCITIGPGGAKMVATPMERGKAIVCALAGPMGSASLLLFSRWLPRIAICGLVQGCYNLLPLLPLDGGNALSVLLSIFYPAEKEKHIMKVFQRIFLLCVLGVSCWMMFRTGIWAFLAAAMLLLLRTGEIKLAKKPIWRYNKANIDKGVRL